jgi:hypothetical protein
LGDALGEVVGAAAASAAATLCFFFNILAF